MKYRSGTILTQWPARTATSSKDRQTGAYSIGLTNPGKLNCPTKKKKSVALIKNLQILIFEMVMRNNLSKIASLQISQDYKIVCVK
jgi:hypothetical protein